MNEESREKVAYTRDHVTLNNSQCGVLLLEHLDDIRSE